MGGVIDADVKAALETRRKLAKVRVQTKARVGAVRRFGCDLDRSGSDQSLNFAHRRQQALLLGGVEGIQHRFREIVGEPVIGRTFGAPFAGQADIAAATVDISLCHGDQALHLQGLQQAAEIARIEPEPAA